MLDDTRERDRTRDMGRDRNSDDMRDRDRHRDGPRERERDCLRDRERDGPRDRRRDERERRSPKRDDRHRYVRIYIYVCKLLQKPRVLCSVNQRLIYSYDLTAI